MNNCQWQHKSQSEISPQKTVVIRNPRGQFRSHDKDGNHSIRSAIAKNPTLTSWLYVLQNRSYCRCKFYIARIGILDLFCFCEFDLDLMTFICKLRPVYHGDISDVQIWTSHVKAYESYRLTFRQTNTTNIIYHTLCRQSMKKGYVYFEQGSYYFAEFIFPDFSKQTE